MSKIIKKCRPHFQIIIAVIFVSVFALSCERPVSISPPDEPPPDGSILIQSTPPDAQIFVNGKDRRRITPDSITWLATGDYEITLKKEFWRDTTFIVSVVEGERTSVSVDYLSNPSMRGAISITSNPENATILIDDTGVEYNAPSEINGILPGYHIVKFFMDNHRPAEKTVVVRSSETSLVSATLVDTTLWKVYSMYDTDLPSNNFTAIFVDSRGILWAGTLEDGLVKYENGIWTNYRTSNSNMPDDKIQCINEAYDGTMWVGMRDGLAQIVYPGTIYKWNSHDSDLHNTHINDIEVDGINVWFATDDGFCRVKMSEDQYWWMDITTSINSNLPGEKVTEFEISGSVKWAGTTTGGLVRFSNSQNLTLHNTANGLFRNTISALEVDRVGVVWAGHSSQVHTTGGLSRYNGAGWDNLSHLIHGEDVTVIYADSKNQRWVGTNRALYLIINSNVTKTFEYNTTGLDFKNVSDICEDPEGYLWIATANDGITRVDATKL